MMIVAHTLLIALATVGADEGALGVAPGTAQPESQAALETRPEVHGRSRTFVLVGSRPYYELSSDSGRLVERREVPIIQDFFLDAKTGVDGLSVALDAWLALDAGEQILSHRLLADITEGYLEWKQKQFTLRAGRVFVQSSVARRDRMDGGWVRLHPKDEIFGGAKLTLDLYGGLPVTPEYGDEVLRASGTPTLAHDPLVLSAGGTDWSRPGDWVAGGMADLHWGHWGGAGIGFVRQNDLAIVDREALVGRFDVHPTRAISLEGSGSYDTYGSGVEDARLTLSGWLKDGLRVGVFARYTNPSLLLPASSIFSTFANETHQDLGLEADLWLWRSTRFSFSGELRQTNVADTTDESADGHRVAISLRGPVPFVRDGRGIISYERLSDGWFGSYDYARIGAEVPVIGWLSVSADGGVFFISGSKDLPATTGGDRTAYRGSLAAVVQKLKDWRVALALRATETPDVSTDVAIIARIEWNAERTF